MPDWHVDLRRDDGALVVSHLDGHGRVVLPAAYVAEHVALAYAVTVHKAEGLTVDRAVLLADSTTTAEHLYVGMSRGRHDNRVCVVTDAATTGHGHRAPPTPLEVLTAVMRRSSVERSATETLREELDRGEDRESLRRLHEQAVAYIERHAGPDRRPELRRLQRLRGELPTMRNLVTSGEREVARLDRDLARARASLSDAEDQLTELTRRRLFRRPDRHAIDRAERRIDVRQRQLQRLQKERARATADLDRSRHRLRDTERAVNRIPDIGAAVRHRRDWLHSHPVEIAWEGDLAARLADGSRAADPPISSREPSASDLVALVESIDLRTIDLSPGRPRAGIERRLEDAFGMARLDDPVDRLPRPPHGRSIEGPDLGLGL